MIFSFFSRKTRNLAAWWIYIFIISLSVVCYRYLPLIDFRPYKVGVNIPKGMEFPENAEHDEYESIFIYADKDGKQQQFTINDYPKDDESWTFIASKPRLIKKGYQPPIHDFSITDPEKGDITTTVISNPSYSFLLISHDLEKANDSNVDIINEIYDYSMTRGYEFYALVSASSDQIQHWTESTGAEYTVCTTEQTALKTIIRSNPGLLLIKDGTIINKWPNTRLPKIDQLTKLIDATNQGKIPSAKSYRIMLLLAALLSIPLGGIYIFAYYDSKKKIKRKINN